MKKILVIGAGRSASTLIKYLLDNAVAENWEVTVADMDLALAQEKAEGHERGRAIAFNIMDEQARAHEISRADLVISLLPPHMHVIPARECLKYRTHMVTASYVSDEMAALDAEAKAAGLLFLNEIGVDPGIDHMSALEMIERIRGKGGKLTAFRSYCGALVAPESQNLWGYKFTWAPRNIILAGQGVAKYLREGMVKFLPYQRLFQRTDMIQVPGHGEFEAYANRDSMKYQSQYGLDGIGTLYRATLRMPGYCKFWNLFVELGMCDDTYKLPNSEGMSYSDFLFSFLNKKKDLSREETFAAWVEEDLDGELTTKMRELGMFNETNIIPLANASPAQILQHILESKWVFEDDDHDMVVMQHQLDYTLDGKPYRLYSSMVDIGRDHTHTAVSRTVGLPAAIAAKHILAGRVKTTGVHIPNFAEIYVPVMEELKAYDIRFTETEVAL